MSTNETQYDFYVIFHGSFAFHDDAVSPEIHVYATEIRGHVYQAGSWMGEQPLVDGGDFTLSGVNSQGATIYGDHTIELEGSPTATAGLRKIIVPRPAHVFFRMIAEGTVLCHDGAVEKTVDWGLVPVFAYCRCSSPVKLIGPHFRWQEPVCGLEPSTLHIWATDDQRRLEQHNDLTKSASIFDKTVTLQCRAETTLKGDVIPDLSLRYHETDELLYTRCDPAYQQDSLASLTTCGPVAGGKVS